ncbi:MAG: hypothetical protein GX482_00255 [Acholeplasmataceae bacterium]|jgi:ABC-2 type transport system ATP-binding protein|nr:hypothetical protein [Acholeplasmataceae bacterium]
MSVLVCENLTKKIKKNPVVSNFSYNFLDNQIYALVGRDNSGRDELLQILAAQIRPDSGKVWLDGEELFGNLKMNKRLCYISEATSFPKHFRIKSIFRLMSWLYPKWDNAYAFELCEYFKIKRKRTYGSLKANEKILFSGIIGLASRANITIFGSALDKIDLKDRFDFYNFVYSHHTRYPRTLIIGTDNVDEIENLIDKILFLDKGRLFETFAVKYIKNNFRLLSGKSEVLKSLISDLKVIGAEERYNILTVCVAKALTKDETRKFQKYLIKISEAPIQKVFVYLLDLREKKGL